MIIIFIFYNLLFILNAKIVIYYDLKNYKNYDGKLSNGRKCEIFWYDECDPIFEYCFETIAGQCDLVKKEHIKIENNVKYAKYIARGYFEINKIQKITLKVQIFDHDKIRRNEHIGDFSLTFLVPGPYPIQFTRTLNNDYAHHTVKVDVYIKLFCDQHYYGSNCESYCTSLHGNYICDNNGDKICQLSCQPHGHCIWSTKLSKFICKCNYGWYGNYCKLKKTTITTTIRTTTIKTSPFKIKTYSTQKQSSILDKKLMQPSITTTTVTTTTTTTTTVTPTIRRTTTTSKLKTTEKQLKYTFLNKKSILSKYLEYEIYNSSVTRTTESLWNDDMKINETFSYNNAKQISEENQNMSIVSIISIILISILCVIIVVLLILIKRIRRRHSHIQIASPTVEYYSNGSIINSIYPNKLEDSYVSVKQQICRSFNKIKFIKNDIKPYNDKENGLCEINDAYTEPRIDTITEIPYKIYNYENDDEDHDNYVVDMEYIDDKFNEKY